MSDATAPSPAVSSGPDLDLRLVRYFTVVAEHLNFARAAAALHVAQPSLSRQIQRLEDALGVRLLERTTQGSTLTAAGAAFLPQAQALLHSSRRAVLAAQDAAPPRTITVGYLEDLVITPAVRDLRRRCPTAHVRTRHLDWDEARALPDGRVDALVARTPLPIPADGLDMTVLYDEPRALLMPTAHRLAREESITAADFADEPLVACAGMAAVWTGFWRLDPRPDGSPAPFGPLLVDTFEDKLEVVADGRAVALVPIDDRRSALRDDLVTVPVEDIEPCQVVVVHSPRRHEPAPRPLLRIREEPPRPRSLRTAEHQSRACARLAAKLTGPPPAHRLPSGGSGGGDRHGRGQDERTRSRGRGRGGCPGPRRVWRPAADLRPRLCSASSTALPVRRVRHCASSAAAAWRQRTPPRTVPSIPAFTCCASHRLLWRTTGGPTHDCARWPVCAPRCERCGTRPRVTGTTSPTPSCAKPAAAA
ncbi:LysR family transcriptional regulator [Streptomyces hygroscopicus]|uniref:LysR family transcriptional regulator n=1 Tax=Streptomyces hygroscopicus TaxID=1912 RepID=UPI00362DA066